MSITVPEMRRWPALLTAMALTSSLAACSPQKIQQNVTGTLQLSSSSIVDGRLPDRSGCKGAGTSPALTWGDPPAGTRAFAVVMEDQDETIGHLRRRYIAHWLAFDLRPDRREMPEGPAGQPMAGDEHTGTNDVRTPGYAGPCPDAGSTHHYRITVYALDTRLDLPSSTDGQQLLTAIDGHILAQGKIGATYTH